MDTSIQYIFIYNITAPDRSFHLHSTQLTYTLLHQTPGDWPFTPHRETWEDTIDHNNGGGHHPDRMRKFLLNIQFALRTGMSLNGLDSPPFLGEFNLTTEGAFDAGKDVDSQCFLTSTLISFPRDCMMRDGRVMVTISGGFTIRAFFSRRTESPDERTTFTSLSTSRTLK